MVFFNDDATGRETGTPCFTSAYTTGVWHVETFFPPLIGVTNTDIGKPSWWLLAGHRIVSDSDKQARPSVRVEHPLATRRQACVPKPSSSHPIIIHASVQVSSDGQGAGRKTEGKLFALNARCAREREIRGFVRVGGAAGRVATYKYTRRTAHHIAHWAITKHKDQKLELREVHKGKFIYT